MSVQRAAAILLMAWLPAVSLAGPVEHGDAVTRLRSEVEALMAAAQRDLQRAPELTREAEVERGKAERLKKALEEALADAQSAEASLAAARAKAEAALAAVREAKSKGEALGGYRGAAFSKLAVNPASPLESAVEAALADDATVAGAVGRVSSEPVAAAARALAAMNAAVQETMAALASSHKALAARAMAAPKKGRGKKARGQARARRGAAGDAAMTLDVLSEAVVSAAACAGVDGALPAGEAGATTSLDVLLGRVERVRELTRLEASGALRALGAKLEREARALAALLPAERTRELLSAFSLEASSALPAELAVGAAREVLGLEASVSPPKAPKAPSAASQLHRSVGQRVGMACTPVGGK